MPRDGSTYPTLSLRPTHRSRAKDAVIALSFRASRALVRQPFGDDLKQILWRRVVRPYIGWRPYQARARTVFGARFDCTLKDYIQQMLLYFGVWEPNITGFIESRLRDGDCFIDVGSNIGYYAILASRLVGPGGKVVAIEASPRIYATLRRHVEINQGTNIRAVNVAASDRKGMLQLFSGPDHNCGMTSTLASRGFDFECEVMAERLDTILSPAEMRSARLVKIDVEGAEAPVLDSIIETIDRYGADVEFIVEINQLELCNFGVAAQTIIDRFAAIGFNTYLLNNDYAPAAYWRRTPRERPMRIHRLSEDLSDVIFSRRDAEML